jgi:hypothetical protein
MRKEGEKLIIEPTPPGSLLALLATLKPLEEDSRQFQITLLILSTCDALLARHQHFFRSHPQSTGSRRWNIQEKLANRASVPASSSLRNCDMAPPGKLRHGSRNRS